MRIANRVERVEQLPKVLATGVVYAGVACVLAITPSLALAQRTGVSHPDTTAITTSDPNSDAPAAVTSPAKPSAAIPAPAAETVYGPYVPYHAPGTSAANVAAQSAAAYDPDANIVTAATAGKDDRMLQSASPTAAEKADPDAGIVTRVISRPGEIADGTLIKVKLRENLSTLTTRQGTKFTAEVTEPVMREGRVIVPVGAQLEGLVTWVRGGRRIGGAAAIHLEPRTIVLPDGAEYFLHAQVIDTGSWDSTKVDGEGTILRRDHGKRTVTSIALATGGTAAAGAMIGGVPGALIGVGVGAGVSTAVWLKQDRQAELPKDVSIVFSLTEPMSITPVSAMVAPAAPMAPPASPGAE